MIRILNSKLLIPDISGTVRREKLLPFLEEIQKKRLTSVVAGTGYGKSTLVAQMVRDSGIKTVWYHLDESDKDLVTFISYLVSGIKKHFREFGGETIRRMEWIQNPKSERTAILTMLVSEVEETVDGEMFIVLDNYYCIQDSDEIIESIEFFLDYLPSWIHLVIVSRVDPNLRLSKLRSSRNMVDLRTEDLAFTMAEIDRLYTKLFGFVLKRESLDLLQRKTDGWVTSLLLFYHSSKGKEPKQIEKQISGLKGSLKIISSYLEENVFDFLPGEIKDFLAKTSILDRLEVDFCNRLLKIDNSLEILSELERSHLFTHVLDEEKERFCYHQLFREFLQKKLNAQEDKESVRNLKREAAILFEEIGHDEEALNQYLEADHFEPACRLLEGIALTLLKKGRPQLLDSYLRRIPAPYLKKESWFQYIDPRMMEISCRFKEAIEGYSKATRYFQRKKSNEDVGRCLLAKGRVHLTSGDSRQAERNLVKLLKRKNLAPYIHIQALRLLITVSSILGKKKATEEYIDGIQSLLSEKEIPKKESLALLFFTQCQRHYNAADVNKAVQFGETAIKMQKEAGKYRRLVLIHYYISMSYSAMGAFDTGFENAREGLRLMEEQGFHDSLSAAMLFRSCSINSAGLGKTKDSIRFAEESLERVQEMDSDYWMARAYAQLSFAHMLDGDLPLAEEYARSAIATKGEKVPKLLSSFEKQLAELLMKKGDLDDALAIVKDSEKILAGSNFAANWIPVLYAQYFWQKNRKGPALQMLLQSLEAYEANGTNSNLVFAKEWIIPLLIDLYAQSKKKAYILKLIQMMYPYAEDILNSIAANGDRKAKKAVLEISSRVSKVPPLDLRIHLFGKFKVFIGGEAIPGKRWKSKKAKTLFKYMLCRRSAGYVPKDVVMELLWPEEDPAKTAKRFHVALAALRKALEPNIVRGTPSSYIVKDGDAYRLSLGANGRLDIEEFSDELKNAQREKNAEKALLHFLNAESIYQGDFLEEDLYVDWCADIRERFKNDYLFVLSAIIKHYENKQNYATSLFYAEKYLKVDKFAEPVFRQVMDYYARTNNISMVVKTYGICKTNIIDDLGCPLSMETEILYKRLARKLEN